jgi:flagellar motor switch protein FliG
LSKRAAEAINEEMGFLGKVKAKDIEMAQMGVIEIVRRLESDGQIEINEEQIEAEIMAQIVQLPQPLRDVRSGLSGRP